MGLRVTSSGTMVPSLAIVVAVVGSCDRTGTNERGPVPIDASASSIATASDRESRAPATRDAGKLPSGSPCSNSDDCGGTDRCVAIDREPACGMAPNDLCHRDDDCPAGLICAPVGHCRSRVCAPRCSGCRAQDTCTDAGHCQVRTCIRDGECPTNFMCTRYGTDARLGECGPKTCAGDRDCQGHCLNGYCSLDPGRCRTVLARP